MSKLKVLFEAGPMLDTKRTGVGYFISHLVTALQNNHPENLELTGYYFNFLNRHKENKPAVSGIKFLKISLMPGKILSISRRLGFQPVLELFVRQKSDAIIYTNYVALPQLRKRKTALVVYDLSFLDIPQYTQDRNLAFLKRFSTPSIKKADIIITISDFTKSRLNHHFPDLGSEIIVTPIPPSEEKAEHQSLTPRLTDLGIKNKAYILYLGTIEPRKNLENLVSAYAELTPETRDKFALVIAGGKGWKDESIRSKIANQQQAGANIIMPGYVTDDEKAALYSNASCFVMPSHYEGFGMPLFEAMQYNTPTLASDIPVFREIADKASLFFDKDNPTDIANKINSVLTDSALSQQLTTVGQARLKVYSWQDNADRLYRALIA